jgi:hypothetical protein
MTDNQDWQFTPEQIGAFLRWLNSSPLRDWRARMWFVAIATTWVSFVVALWLALWQPDVRLLAFAGVWLFLTVLLAAGAVERPGPRR